MKNLLLTLALVLGSYTNAQTDSEKEYDFSLQGAVEMFKKSNSIEEFEQLINQEENDVNNLDLNNDGETDYIQVNTFKENDDHIVVLSAIINENEVQDIATISIEKDGNESATLEIVGNEEVFDQEIVFEPAQEEMKSKKGNGPSFDDSKIYQVRVNVWFWPSVRFMFAPRYVVWASPVRFKVFPRWFRPWRPVKIVVFHNKARRHHVFYRPTVIKIHNGRKIYASNRRSSTVVIKNRRGTTVVHKGRRGNVKVVKVKHGRRG